MLAQMSQIDLAIGFELSSTMTINDYTFLKVVGRGKFGMVLEVRNNKDGNTYAMKVVKKMKLIQQKCNKISLPPRNVLSNIEHPFICSLQHAFQSETKIYLVLDCLDAGELFYNI